MFKALRKRWWVALVVLGVMLIAPLSVSATTAPEALQIMAAVIEGILRAGRDAYCATGTVPLCP